MTRYHRSDIQMHPSRAKLLQVIIEIVLVVVWNTQLDFTCESKLALP
jgi:hypothetical protein